MKIRALAHHQIASEYLLEFRNWRAVNAALDEIGHGCGDLVDVQEACRHGLVKIPW